MTPRTCLFRRILAGVAAAALGGSPLSCAPPPPKRPTPSRTIDGRDAREVYKEAVAAFKKGDYPAAYRAFADVWAVEKKPKVAGNLGRTELKLKKYCSAVEHLTIFLDGQDDLSPPERSEIERLRETARRSTSALRVEVQPAGAEVFVDQTSMGTAPLSGELCLDPGKHRLEARQGDRKTGADVWAAPRVKMTKRLELPPKSNSTP